MRYNKLKEMLFKKIVTRFLDFSPTWPTDIINNSPKMKLQHLVDQEFLKTGDTMWWKKQLETKKLSYYRELERSTK